MRSKVIVLVVICVCAISLWWHYVHNFILSDVEIRSDGQIYIDGRNVPLGEFERFIPDAPIIFSNGTNNYLYVRTAGDVGLVTLKEVLIILERKGYAGFILKTVDQNIEFVSEPVAHLLNSNWYFINISEGKLYFSKELSGESEEVTGGCFSESLGALGENALVVMSVVFTKDSKIGDLKPLFDAAKKVRKCVFVLFPG